MKEILLALLLTLVSSYSFADDIWIFSASWCGPCKNLKSFLKTYHKTLKSEGHNISIIDIDFDKELKRKYQINAVPTTIVFDDNKIEKGRLEGYSKNVWTSWIKNTTK